MSTLLAFLKGGGGVLFSHEPRELARELSGHLQKAARRALLLSDSLRLYAFELVFEAGAQAHE